MAASIQGGSVRRFFLLWVVALGFPCVWPAADAALGQTAVGDFNGDGRADLAVGVDFEDVSGRDNAGAVNVIYGTASGLSTYNQLWHQDQLGVDGSPGQDNFFGSDLAAGDFNGDGFADLAVGVPGEGVQNVLGAGAVNVLYGSAAVGLTSSGDQFWRQNGLGGEVAERDDFFGSALAGGDFNRDGFTDLAVGVRSEDLISPFFGNVADAGAVHVIYGSASRLSSTGSQFWHKDNTPVPPPARAAELFGHDLAAGDFNGDGCADLAIGVPRGHNLIGPGSSAVGAVDVLYCGASGLSGVDSQAWDVLDLGRVGAPEDGFGFAVAAGNFNGDGFADLAVGAPFDDVGGKADAGAVDVIYGSASRLSATGSQFWHQDTLGVRDVVNAGDLYGSALAAGDFNGDRCADLAVGVPDEDIVINLGDPESTDIGAVNVLYCRTSMSSEMLSAMGDEFWHQGTGIGGPPEQFDRFGWAVAAGNFDGAAGAELAVGVPFEDLLTVGDAGMVNVIYSTGIDFGLEAPGAQKWHQDSGVVIGIAEALDHFGVALTP
jgi:hypothetical protein